MKYKKTLFFVFTVLLLSSISFEACSQRFRYGLNLGYTNVKYSFPVTTDRYHEADIEPFFVAKGGASVHFLFNRSFRIGAGIQYMALSGKKDGGQIEGSSANPNSSGTLTYEANNSFLIFPVEFMVILLKDARIKPILSAGLNFFAPLKQNILIEITPSAVNPFYDFIQTEISKDTPSEYFGFFAGAGIIVPVNKHEVALLLNYRTNTSRYVIKNAFYANAEKHEIKFNMLEISLGWTFR